MANHFSTLGFDLRDNVAIRDFIMHTAVGGKWIVLPDGGAYVLWTPGAGIEMWTQVDPDRQIIGFNPHFGGQARIRVGLTSRISRPDDNALDGAFYGWAGVQEGGDPELGAYPFVFDTPDFRAHDEVALPAIVAVQLAAFAHTLKAYSDEEAFRASETHMAAESCIPSGLFTVSPPGETVPPASQVIFNGHVTAAALLTNPHTSLTFHWARVKTLGGEYDVVADPAIVEGEIVPHGVVSVSGWVSGRIMPA